MEEVEKFLHKAEQSIEAAEMLFRRKMYSFSASRSYYALFYIAEALLLNEGKSFDSHKAVISEFGRIFAKGNLVDAKFHKYLIEGYSKRQIGDYEVIKDVDEISARVMIQQAKEFLVSARKYLVSPGEKNK